MEELQKAAQEYTGVLAIRLLDGHDLAIKDITGIYIRERDHLLKIDGTIIAL